VLLGFARLVFGVRIVGSIALLLGVSLIGALAFAGIGLLVAARAQNTQTVTGLINLVMLPMFVASASSSPPRASDAVQPFLRVLPLTALNDGLRAVMIDGAGVTGIAGQIALLGVTTAATSLPPCASSAGDERQLPMAISFWPSIKARPCGPCDRGRRTASALPCHPRG